MEKYKGLKVIGFREKVDGYVVEIEHGAKFKIVKYYHNEFGEYLNEDVDEFEIKSSDDLNTLWKNFKEELKNHVSLKNTYIQEDVFALLTTSNEE